MGNEKSEHLYTESKLGEIRYKLEHEVLKNRFFDMPEAMMKKLMADRGAYSLYALAFNQWRIDNPYKPSDFNMHVRNLREGGMCICLELPYPEYVPLCQRIYLLSNENYSRCAYYTVEIGPNYGALCEWKKDSHIIHTPIDTLEWPEENSLAMMEEELQLVENYFYESVSTEKDQEVLRKPFDDSAVNNAPQEGFANSVAANTESENLFKGIIGAFLGSLAGVAAIVLLDAIGFVAAIAGCIMAVATIVMYENFAGGISKKGVIVCVIVMVAMTLFAVNLSFSIQVARELKESGYQNSATNLPYIFKELYNLMDEGLLSAEAYWKSLAMKYGFTALGAYGTIRSSLSDSEQ